MGTIVDVARQAGVSTSTVSHVVNATRPVSEETRRRVEAAIVDCEYSQDGLARALRRKRSDSIGLVVSDTSQHDFAELARGIERDARDAGQTLLLTNSDEDPDRELASVKALLGRRVDGLLVAPVAQSRLDLQVIDGGGAPIVLVDRLIEPRVDQVGVDNVVGIRRVVQHLIGLGHTRIGLVAGDRRVSTLMERYEGYRLALIDADLDCSESLIVQARGLSDNAREHTARLLASPARPTAIVSASAQLAVGTLQAIRDVGLSIPGDIAFVSVDLPANSELFTPPLTSVVQPAFDMGRRAMGLLARRLTDRRAAATTVRLRPAIRHGQSCGCPPDAEALTIDAR